jgi:hypothetical protein
MRVIKQLTTLVAFAALGCSAGPELDTRTFRLEHLEGFAAAEIVAPYVYTDRPDAPGTLSHQGNVLTVRETLDNLEKIARVLEELDTAEPGVQLRFQIIEANGAATSDPAIAEVEAELRKLFQFRGYRLLAEAFVGGVEGSSISQAVSARGEPYAIDARIHRVQVSDAGGSVMLTVALRLPNVGSTLESTVNVPVGKTVVLGNGQLDPQRGPLILTVRPELVQP